MKPIEDFLRTKYDLYKESTDGGVCLILEIVGTDRHITILPEFIQHFFDMGERKYLVGRALQLYKKILSMKEYI